MIRGLRLVLAASMSLSSSPSLSRLSRLLSMALSFTRSNGFSLIGNPHSSRATSNMLWMGESSVLRVLE